MHKTTVFSFIKVVAQIGQLHFLIIRVPQRTKATIFSSIKVVAQAGLLHFLIIRVP